MYGVDHTGHRFESNLRGTKVPHLIAASYSRLRTPPACVLARAHALLRPFKSLDPRTRSRWVIERSAKRRTAGFRTPSIRNGEHQGFAAALITTIVREQHRKPHHKGARRHRANTTGGEVGFELAFANLARNP